MIDFRGSEVLLVRNVREVTWDDTRRIYEAAF